MFAPLAAFVRLARPVFLAGGFAGFGLGAAVAWHDGHAFSWTAYLFGQALVTSFHLMVHFANDYYDESSDALSIRTAWSGGSGVLTRGELPRRAALVAALICAGLGAILTVRAGLSGNVPLAFTGVAIGVFAWCYSAPPFRLLERGVGELDTVLVVAILVPVAGYAALANGVGVHALVMVLPGMCAMFAMMLSVEIPDYAADLASGKRNLVVRWGVATAAILARTFATGAVLVLFLVGTSAFVLPAVALLALVPAGLIALAYAAPSLVAAYAFLSIPFLGVASFALTTAAAIVFALTAVR